MKSNILAFFFTIGSIGMAVLIVWFYNLSDRVTPDMRFTAMDLTYDRNTKEQDLLGGVMAYDAVDGDITDRIVVEKTILNEEQQTAVVYYAVSDLSGNVTKMSRVFPADIDSLKNTEDSEFIAGDGYPQMSEGESGTFVGGFDTTGWEDANADSESEDGEGSSDSAEESESSDAGTENGD